MRRAVGTDELQFRPRLLETFEAAQSFGPDGLLYVSAGKRLLRFDATSGAFVDEFATAQTSVVTGFVFAP